VIANGTALVARDASLEGSIVGVYWIIPNVDNSKH